MLLMLLKVIFSMPSESSAAAPTEAGVGIFYSSLSPYGEWVNVEFGRAWRPLHVVHGWRPYVNGQWVWTDYGWYWMSDEPFGWATFHYGRWYYDDFYGWVWVPGEVWGPAWVEWRYSNDYIGWAPLAPYAEFSFNVGITYTNRWAAPVHYWNFVPGDRFASARVVDYVQPVEQSRRIFGSTRVTGSIRTDGGQVVNRGVDVSFVERHGNLHINRVNIVSSDKRTSERFVGEADRRHIEVYRPRMEHRTQESFVRPPARTFDRNPERHGNIRRNDYQRPTDSTPRRGNVGIVPSDRMNNRVQEQQRQSQGQWNMYKGNFKQVQPKGRIQERHPAVRAPHQEQPQRSPKREKPEQRPGGSRMY